MESCHRDNWRRVAPTKKPSGSLIVSSCNLLYRNRLFLLILSRLVCFSRGNLDNLHFHSRQVGKLSEMLQASHFHLITWCILPIPFLSESHFDHKAHQPGVQAEAYPNLRWRKSKARTTIEHSANPILKNNVCGVLWGPTCTIVYYRVLVLDSTVMYDSVWCTSPSTNPELWTERHWSSQWHRWTMIQTFKCEKVAK